MTSIIQDPTSCLRSYVDKDFSYVIFLQTILTVFVLTKKSKLNMIHDFDSILTLHCHIK